MTEAKTVIRSKVSHHLAPFVVVSNPGTIFERIEEYCCSVAGAREYLKEFGCPVEIMKVLPSGNLTTEF